MEKTIKSTNKSTISMVFFHIPLRNREAKVYDSNSSLDLLEILQDILDCSSDLDNIFQVIQSGLYHEIVPHTCYFPKLTTMKIPSSRGHNENF